MVKRFRGEVCAMLSATDATPAELALFISDGLEATGLLMRVRPRGIRGKPSSVDTELLPSASLSSVADPASEGFFVRSSSAMLSLAKSNSGCGVFLCSNSVSHHASSSGKIAEPSSHLAGGSPVLVGLQCPLGQPKKARLAPRAKLSVVGSRSLLR